MKTGCIAQSLFGCFDKSNYILKGSIYRLGHFQPRIMFLIARVDPLQAAVADSQICTQNLSLSHGLGVQAMERK